MSKRERTLAIVFGAVIVVGVGLRFGSLSSLRAMVDYGPQIREVREELMERELQQAELEESLTRKYHDYVLRTGGTDPSDVRDDFYDRLVNLRQYVNLREWTTAPKDPSINSKTKIATIRCSVNATGPYAECIKFIEEVYKLPYLARFSSLTLSPVTVSQKPYEDKVKLDGDIEILVLPEKKLLGVPRGPQPENHRAYASANFNVLRNWKPFIPYKPPDPPRPKPPVVKPEPKDPVVAAPREAEEPVDPDAGDTVLRMVLGYGVKEVMLRNTATGGGAYAGIGELLDGGTIVLIHTLGAVVHKEAEGKDFGFFVYPIGERLDTRVALTEAVEWPEIQYAMQRYFDARPRIVDTNGLNTNGLNTNGLYTNGFDPNGTSNALTHATDPPAANAINAAQRSASQPARSAAVPAAPTDASSSEPAEDLVGPPAELAGPVDQRNPAKVANAQRGLKRADRTTRGPRASRPPDDQATDTSTNATTNAVKPQNPTAAPDTGGPAGKVSTQPVRRPRVQKKVESRAKPEPQTPLPKPARSRRQPKRATPPQAETAPVADATEVADGTAEDDEPSDE